jgi:heme-degrading monooxygenase HmoA
VSTVATLTVVRYTPARATLGAWHMAAQRPLLARVPGLRFARLMGTGQGIGFSAVPDFRTWALFAVWEDVSAWERFAAESRVMRQYHARGEEVYSLVLSPLDAHGRWGGEEPFPPPARPERPDPDAPIVVLTRATIRPARALRFWSRVAPVDATLRGHPDLLLSFGVGEVPYLKQATLSVWRSAAAMRAWAATPAHAETVRLTRAENWYSEELFARFRLLGTRGTWLGREPLEAVLRTMREREIRSE